MIIKFWRNFFHGPSGQRASLTREVLLKGKAEYGWPPCLDQLPFILKILFIFRTKQATQKTSYLNEEVNFTETLPPQLVFRGLTFVGKAGAYPGGGSQRCNEILDEDKIAKSAKHTSLRHQSIICYSKNDVRVYFI